MIKSGAVIQNRYLNNPYPTNYNPLGRPGNFDVARPHDSSSVFDTGMPKDVSPYQPRVAVSVEIQPKSVFKPRRLQRQAKQINGAKWGQTALKNIFGGEENVITNYMAQRLLGIVENSRKEDDRITESMLLDDPFAGYREKTPASTEVTSKRQSTVKSDQSMDVDGVNTTPEEIADLNDLRLGEGFLTYNTIPTPANQPPGFNPFFLPGNQPTNPDLQAALDEPIGEVETQPLEAATQGGLMIPPPPPLPPIVQQTSAGITTTSQRDRTIKRAPVEGYLNKFSPADLQGVKLKKVSQSKPIQKKTANPLMDALGAAISKRRQALDSNDNSSGEWA